MSFASERVVIEARFSAQWALGSFSTVSVAYENRHFDPSGSEYVTVSILSGGGQEVSIGRSATHRYVGLIQNSIFVRQGSGTQRLREIADAVKIVWSATGIAVGTTGFLHTQTTSIGPVQYDGTWARIDCSTTYSRDQRETRATA